MFTVTENAVTQIQKSIQESDTKDLALRIAAQYKEDKKIHYLMGFDEVKQEDHTVHIKDVKIVMDPQSHTLLDEATMDFAALDGETEAHFIFLNPLDPDYVAPKKIPEPSSDSEK